MARMLFSLSAPTYSKVNEKESANHKTTRKAATTVTIFIINCLRENSNDFAATRRRGRCKCAISRIKVSSPPRRASAAPNAMSTPAKYTATTAKKGCAKKAEHRVR